MKKYFTIIIPAFLFLILINCGNMHNDVINDFTSESKPELIKNSSFSTNDLTDWNFYTNSASAEWTIIDGEVNINTITGIKNPSSDISGVWEIQLNQNGIPLENGKAYIISFDAFAESEREIKINCQESNNDINGDLNNYSSYNGSSFFTITTERHTYTRIFYMNHPSDTNAQFTIAMGNNATTFTIDNISLKETSFSVPSAGTNLVSNGNFNDKLTGWDYSLGSGGVGVMQVVNNELNFAVTTNAAISVVHYGLILENGKEYKISLKARAVVGPYSLSVLLGENDCDFDKDANFYTPYVVENFYINSSMIGYSFSFIMNNPTDYNAMLLIDLDSTSSCAVFFDDVSVIEITK
jgi:hypothetical protein